MNSQWLWLHVQGLHKTEVAKILEWMVAGPMKSHTYLRNWWQSGVAGVSQFSSVVGFLRDETCFNRQSHINADTDVLSRIIGLNKSSWVWEGEVECDSGAREKIVGEERKDGFDKNQPLHTGTKRSNNRIFMKISLAAPVSSILSWCKKKCYCVFLMRFLSFETKSHPG